MGGMDLSFEREYREGDRENEGRKIASKWEKS